MLRKSNKFTALILSVLMIVSMLTCIVLPVSAETETPADPYAKINATKDGTVYVPADNVYFIDNAIDNTDEPAYGETIEYTYGNGTTWGDGKTYQLVYDVNMFGSFADAKSLIIAKSAEWAADSANIADEIVLVFAPGSFGSSTGQITASSLATDPTQDDLFSVVMLGPQAGKSPVSTNRSTEAAAEEVQNDRGTSNTEFWFDSTIWLPDNCISYMDGFAARKAGKVYIGGTYANATVTNMYFTTTSGSTASGRQFIALGVVVSNKVTNNIIADINNTYFNLEHAYTGDESATYLCGNSVSVTDCVFAKGTLSSNHKYNQTHHMNYYPTSKDNVSANFYGADLAANPRFVFSNNVGVNWESCHFLRLKPTTAAYTSYGTSAAIDIQITDNHFYDMNQYAGTGDIIYIDKITTKAQAQSFKLAITGNLFLFSMDWETIKTAGKYGSVLNAAESQNVGGYNWVITDNTFIMQPTTGRMAVYQLAASIDMSGNLFMDHDGNIIPNRVHGSGYQATFTSSAAPHSDVYASDEKNVGVRELFTVKEIENGTLCYCFIQLNGRGNTTNKNYLRGVLTVLLKRNDDGTCIEYDADTLLKFNKNVTFHGIYEEEACTTRVNKVTQDTVDGLYAKATYEAGNTKCTVIFMLTVPTNYRIVDPENDYVTTGYKFNGVTYMPGETGTDGVTADKVTRADGTEGFYEFIDNSHKDADGNTIPSAYNGIGNPTQYCCDASNGGDLHYNAMKTIIVLTPGTYDFTGQSMGKNVSFVGPQFGVSPYGEDNKDGKLANGRSVDPTKEAVVKGYLSLAGDASYNYSFDGITFAGEGKAITGTANGNLTGTQWQTVSIRNCVFANSAQQVITLSSDMTNGIKQFDILIADSAVYATGVDREVDSLFYIRSNMFTMKNFAVIDDCNGAMASSSQRLVYLTLNNPAHFRVPHMADYARFENVILYNSNRNLVLYSLRENAALDATNENYPNGIELTINNCWVKGGSGYFFGTQSNQEGDGGELIRLTATNNYFNRSDYTGYVLNNYQESKGTGINAYTEDSAIKNNVFISGSDAMNFMLYAAEMNIDENFIGKVKNGSVVPAYVRAAAINPEDTNPARGVEKDLYVYYLDEAMTVKNTAAQLENNSYKAFSRDYFLGYNQANIEVENAGATVESLFKATDGATILGVYTDEEMTTAASGIITKPTTFYVNIKNDASGLTCMNKVNVVLPCSHASTKTAGTRVEATCGTDGYQEYTCDDCGAVIPAWTEVLTATGAHVWDAGVETTPATCYSEGVTTYTCTNDNCLSDGTKATKTEPITKLAHTYPAVWTVIQEPTCQTAGTKVMKCTVAACNALLITEKIPVVSCETADANVWVETTPATCEVDGVEKQFCKWCQDELASRAIPMLGHDWDEGIEDPVANCKDDGLLTQTCKNDPTHKKETVIPSTGQHGFVGTVVTPATCTTAGVINYYCSGCKVSHDEEIPMLGHNYTATVTKEATCVEDGVMTYTCANCGDDYTEAIASNGQHVYVATVTTEATCNTTGVMTYDCGNCDASYTETIPATRAHDYEAVVTKEATCTEDGEMTYTCKKEDCKHVKTEVIAGKGGHQYGAWTLGKNSTCSVAGYDYRICMECGDEERRDRELIDHVWDDEFTVDIQPTGTVRGEKSRHCKMCDARTDITDMGYCQHENALGEWIVDREETCVELGIKHQVCDLCGDDFNVGTDIPMIPHNLTQTGVITPATCTEDGVMGTHCSICNLDYTEAIDAFGHNEGIWNTVTAPTCTAEGQAEKRCVTCDAVLDSKVIPATNHSCGYEWVVADEPTCIHPGLEEYTCKDCGYVAAEREIDILGHQDVHVDTVPATCTEDGSREYICLICDMPLSVTIPAIGHTAGDWEVVKPATTTSHGEKVKKCVTCGEVVESEYIEQIVNEGHPFVDVPTNSWYNDAVEFVYNSGIMNGVDATHFNPNGETTRGMFVTILGRLSGVDADDYTYAYFEDVKDDAYYFGYVEWARVNGIVSGTGNYVFEPDRAITRQEMCKMIVEYSDYEDIDLELTKAKVTFKDDAKIAKWAKTYVYTCQRSGVVNGDASGYFRPTDTAKRCEVATLIMNFYNNNIK